MSYASVLTINSGSSSVKFQVFGDTEGLVLLASGKVCNLGTNPVFIATNEDLNQPSEPKPLKADANHEQAIHLILDWINQQPQHWDPKAVAHRVVHGGTLYQQSVIITPEIMKQLEKLSPLAPLHQPHNLKAIEIIQKINPKLTQVACFDTAFHAQHTPLFTEYALPKNIRDQGVRRYGFHGLSFEWIAHTLKLEHPDEAQGRVIAAHLGNGASLCAMLNGISIDTTMGLTALDGLPMGTRCGSLDPGAVLYMIRDLGLTPNEVEHIYYNQSGLLGLSGLTNDVKELQNNPAEPAQFALDYFSLKVAQFMGMMAIALGGVDAIIFTGGIGENSELVRTKVLQRIQCLQPFSTRVIPANEEKMMAMHTLSLIEHN